MKKYLILILLLSVSLFGASFDRIKAEKIACPSQDFSKFIQVYSEDIKVQKNFTFNPLERLYLDKDAEPEPKQIVETLNITKFVFPLIPKQANRKVNHLDLNFKKIGVNKVKLTLSQPDSDYTIDYYFSNQNSCWKLERIEDWSL